MGRANSSANNGKRGGIILIYMVIGPPIGGLLVYLYFLSATVLTYMFDWRPNGAGDVTLQPMVTIAGLFGFIVVFSYVFGGVQAFLTGILIAVASNRDGTFGYFTAIVAPAVVGAITMAVLAATNQTPLEASAMLGGIGVCASATIRFLFRRHFGN